MPLLLNVPPLASVPPPSGRNSPAWMFIRPLLLNTVLKYVVPAPVLMYVPLLVNVALPPYAALIELLPVFWSLNVAALVKLPPLPERSPPLLQFTTPWLMMARELTSLSLPPVRLKSPPLPMTNVPARFMLPPVHCEPVLTMVSVPVPVSVPPNRFKLPMETEPEIPGAPLEIWAVSLLPGTEPPQLAGVFQSAVLPSQ